MLNKPCYRRLLAAKAHWAVCESLTTHSRGWHVTSNNAHIFLNIKFKTRPFVDAGWHVAYNNITI